MGWSNLNVVHLFFNFFSYMLIGMSKTNVEYSKMNKVLFYIPIYCFGSISGPAIPIGMCVPPA